MPRSSIYLEPADDVRELFCDYVSSDGDCIVLSIGSNVLNDQAHDALQKTVANFGYGIDACSFASIHPRDPSIEGGDVPLDAQALFMLIEGLDPLCLICADAASARLLENAYRESYDLNSAVRVFGRPAVVFDDFERMLQTDAGKQRAWHLLKSLPKR